MAFPVLGKNSAKTNEAKQTFVGQPRNVCLEICDMGALGRLPVRALLRHPDLKRRISELKRIRDVVLAEIERAEAQDENASSPDRCDLLPISRG